MPWLKIRSLFEMNIEAVVRSTPKVLGAEKPTVVKAVGGMAPNGTWARVSRRSRVGQSGLRIDTSE